MEPQMRNYPQGVQVPATTNYFQLKLGGTIFKYMLEFVPKLPENKQAMIREITRQKDVCQVLKEKLESYTILNFSLYSPTSADEDIVIKTQSDGVEREIRVTNAGSLNNNDREALNIWGGKFRILQRKTNMIQIGRKIFNPKRERQFPEFKVSVWPGFATSLNRFNSEFLVNIDLSFKVLRQETVWNVIEDRFRQGLREDDIREELKGSTILTKYNNKLYQISDVCFDLGINYEFEEKKAGQKISILQYFQKKYNIQIREKTQPLIKWVDRKNPNNTIYLVPELCSVTGLNDQQRTNFNLMKQLSTMTKPEPSERISQAQELIKTFGLDEQAREIMKSWNLKISNEPYKVNGTKYDAGHYVMGRRGPDERSLVRCDGQRDIEQKIQQPMYSQPEISKWAIFYGKRETDEYNKFVFNLEKAMETFKYKVNPPKEVVVNGNQWRDWEDAMEIIQPGVQAAVFILGGAKKKGMFYNEIKNVLIGSKPVPSQVVLASTLKNDRSVRSIVNNVLMQICAKVGGIPWAMENMPFVDQPTMIVGIDLKNNASGKQQSYISLCATVDTTFTRYWSTFRRQDSGLEIGSLLQPAMEGAIQAFQDTNRCKPKTIIIFREGVSDSQRKLVESLEIPPLRNAFKKLGESPNLIFVCVNKKVNAKFFVGDNLKRGDMRNPDPGTVFSGQITSDRDFYLVSHFAKQGAASPSHYYVLVNDLDKFEESDVEKLNQAERHVNREVMAKIQLLSYKLCYLYYNSVNSIKVPSPIQYASRLTELVGDKLAKFKIRPHQHLASIKSLYFI